MPVEEFLTHLIEEGADLLFVAERVIAREHIVEHVELMRLTLRLAGRVDGIEGVLLQIHGIEQLALLVEDVILGRGALFADDLHHLIDLAAAAEDAAGLLHTRHVHHALIL